MNYNILSLEELKEIKEQSFKNLSVMAYGKYRNRAKKEYEEILKIYKGKLEEHQRKIGEYFADYDEETELYCVFHTDFKTGHAFSSWGGMEEAERDAEQRNNK